MTFLSEALAHNPIAGWRLGEAALVAPPYVAQTTLSPNTGTSFTVTPPSQAAGRCVIVAGTAGVSGTITPPAGWTTALSLAATTGTIQSKFYVFYRIIQPGDATTWTFSGSTGGSTGAFSCTVYDDVSVVEATTSNSDNGGSSSTSWAGPTITAGAIGPYRLVHCVGSGRFSGAPNETLDAALAARSSIMAGNFYGMAVGDEVVSAGATTARTTTSTNTQQWAEVILLLAGTAVDASGNGHHGAYVGSPTLGVTGLIAGDADTAVTLATGKYVSTAANAAYDIAHPAIVAFIRGSSFANSQMIASQADGSASNHWYLDFLTGGKVEFAFISSGGAAHPADSGTTVVNDNIRHMLVGRYDGTFIDIFIDNVRVAHVANSSVMNIGAGIPVYIGAQSNANHTGAITIDEVWYYDATDLTDAAIAALWDAANPAVVAQVASAGMTVGASVSHPDSAALAASSGMSVAATTNGSSANLTATSSLAVGGTVGRLVTATATRTRNTAAFESGDLPVDVGYGSGWESVSRGRFAIATVEAEDPDLAEPPDHHRINRVWLDITAVHLDSPDRMPQVFDFTEHSVDWGRYQIRVSGKDVTWFRGNHTLITELSDTEPGGDDTCTLMFPGIGPYEILGYNDLDWLPTGGGDPHIPVKILRVKPDGTKTVQFEGDAYAEEDTQDGSGSGLVLHCNGLIKTLDDRITKPRFTSDPIDIATFVHRLIKEEIKYGWPGHAPAIDLTGIETAERGQYGAPLWSDTIQNILATAQYGEDTQYTLANKRPRGMQWTTKDDTTIDISAYTGQRGVTHSLMNDNSRKYDVIYGEGQAGGMRYWRNTQYPNAHAAGDIPDYPADPSVTFSAGDSDSSLHLFFDELDSRNYNVTSNNTYLASDIDEVERFQTEAGITVDGVIGPQTWTRAFQDALDRHVLDAYVRPLAERLTAEPYLYNSHGGIIGDNPVYDHRLRREVLEQFGTLERRQARRSARLEILTIHGTNYIGTVTFTNIDPPEMCALDIRAGMNLSFRHHRGPGDRLLHIVRVDRDPGMAPGASRTVTLTVTERPDDYITVAERISRRRGVIDQSGRAKPPRRSSARTPDFAPWDEESGAGRLLPIAQFGGLWNVIPIPAGERGEIVHVRLVADRPTLISAAVFNWHVSPNQLTNLPGLANPHVGIGGSSPPDPWQANTKILTDRPTYADQPWLAWASGALDSMQGYYPHDPSTDSGTITGVLDDAFTWPYHARRAPWLWLAIWTSVSCVISGDPVYKHRALWNAPDTG